MVSGVQRSIWKKRIVMESRHLIYAIVLISLVISCNGHNKYSKEANKQKELRDLEKPFRIGKINLLWAKAQKRLTDAKLKSIFSELKLHDQEELKLKRLKADGSDPDGLKEAELRMKMKSIIERYGLGEHFTEEFGKTSSKPSKQDKAFNEASEDHINKSIFKDKKLNKLWMKAEASGFTPEEMMALKEEFIHHQEKVDQYHSLLEVEDKKDKNDNNVHSNHIHLSDLEKEEPVSVDVIKQKRKEIKDGYDRLHEMSVLGPKSKEFSEPKVQELWKAAQNAAFNQDELESLREELRHYEHRLKKLQYLHAEAALKVEKPMKKLGDGVSEKLKNHERKAEKLHRDLESRIMQRHIDL